jgi:hypothetical protein
MLTSTSTNRPLKRALALQQRRERNAKLGNTHGPKPFTAEASQQWL